MASLTPGQLQKLLDGPAVPPPPGQQALDPNAPSLVHRGQVVDSVLFALTTLVIFLRLATNAILDKRWWPEDYFGLVFWCCQLGSFVAEIFILKTGIGRHSWDITLRSFLNGQFYINLDTIFYAPGILAIKIAILLQLIRLFVPTTKHNRTLFWGSWIWIGIISVFYTVDFFLSVFQCTPRAKITNPFLPGKCINTELLFQATGIFNILSDFFILVLPIRSIYQLHCNWKKKARIGAVFTIGAIACVSSIVRTWYTWRLFETTDTSWGITYVGYWTWVEVFAGALVFCLPTFPRPFLMATIKASTFWGSITSRSARSGSGTSRLPSTHEDGTPNVPETPTDQDSKKQKPYMPHMVVSLASWEEADQADGSEAINGHTGAGRPITKSIPMQPLASIKSEDEVSRADESMV